MFEVIDQWPKDESSMVFDHLIGDPPYDEKTHAGARTGSAEKKLVPFAALPNEALAKLLFKMAQHVRRWAVFTAASAQVRMLENSQIPGWEFIREGIWVKLGAAPQFTGDRPGTGWEKLAILHRVKSAHCPKHERIRWNGGGRNSVFTHPVERGAHETQKPVSLFGEIIRLFTDPGEWIIDPMCGSGTTLVAAQNHARNGVGIEVEERYLIKASRRLAQQTLPLGGV